MQPLFDLLDPMETKVPDEFTAFQEIVQSGTTIRQILQRIRTLLGYDQLHPLLLNGCMIFLGELMSLCRPTNDLPGGHSTTDDPLNRGRLFLRCYERFYSLLIFNEFNFPSPAIHDNKLKVQMQLADIESKILKLLDLWYVNCFKFCNLDAETIRRVTHRPWTDQIVAGRQKLEADFNSYMESISSYSSYSSYMESISSDMESILLISASSRAPLYRVWDLHRGDIGAASRALYSELVAHPGNHSQLHQVPSAHPGSHSQLHQVPSTHPGNHAMLHSQLHPVPSTHPGNHPQLHLVPSTHPGSHAMLHSQLHPVPSTHPGNHPQLHLVPSTHLGSHPHPGWDAGTIQLVIRISSDSLTDPIVASREEPQADFNSDMEANNATGSHNQNVTQGSPNSTRVEEPRFLETILAITSQTALTMLTIRTSGGSTSFSQNQKILFCLAVAFNVIGFLCFLFAILVRGSQRPGIARIVTGTGFICTAYAFIGIMGMLLKDNIMLWVTGLAGVALFPVFASAFVK